MFQIIKIKNSLRKYFLKLHEKNNHLGRLSNLREQVVIFNLYLF
jgi:hypothetical protein